jgi:glycosyltransferase involved in cell wall biosynthesis
MNPLISIIIPVYNHAHTLRKTIEDIFRQTYRPLEVIVVNDGSTDDFEAAASVILNEMKDPSRSDKRDSSAELQNDKQNIAIQILSQENKGAPSARNLGFASSKGEYVIFWDADTLASPQMLEKMFEALQNNPQSAYAYSQFKFGWKVIKSQNFDADKLRQVNYIDTTSLIRRSALSSVPWDTSLRRFQDWDLWLSLLEKNQTGVFVPEVLYKKIVEGRVGISNWMPSFIYKLPWKTKRVRKYEEAKQIILKKHGLSSRP